MLLYLKRSCLDSILYKFFPKSVSFRTIPEIYWSLERQERENVNRVWEGGNRWGFTLAEIWIRAPWGWHRLQGLQEEQILKSKSSWALPFITWYFLLLWFLLFFLWCFFSPWVSLKFSCQNYEERQQEMKSDVGHVGLHVYPSDLHCHMPRSHRIR